MKGNPKEQATPKSALGRREARLSAPAAFLHFLMRWGPLVIVYLYVVAFHYGVAFTLSDELIGDASGWYPKNTFAHIVQHWIVPVAVTAIIFELLFGAVGPFRHWREEHAQ